MTVDFKTLDISLFDVPLVVQKKLREAIKENKITEEEAIKLYNEWKRKRTEILG